MNGWSLADSWLMWELQLVEVSEWYAPPFEITDLAVEWAQEEGRQ